MMTMSKALSAGQAKNYYQKEYTSAKENYYSGGGEVTGRWSGELAEQCNLTGEVQSEQYERLCAGQDPHTGEQLIELSNPAKRTTTTAKKSPRPNIVRVGTRLSARRSPFHWRRSSETTSESEQFIAKALTSRSRP